eukprot:COSAG01_NODE_7124_length_3331_cov_48.437346_2_plen_406_part_01
MASSGGLSPGSLNRRHAAEKQVSAIVERLRRAPPSEKQRHQLRQAEQLAASIAQASAQTWLQLEGQSTLEADLRSATDEHVHGAATEAAIVQLAAQMREDAAAASAEHLLLQKERLLQDEQNTQQARKGEQEEQGQQGEQEDEVVGAWDGEAKEVAEWQEEAPAEWSELEMLRVELAEERASRLSAERLAADAVARADDAYRRLREAAKSTQLASACLALAKKEAAEVDRRGAAPAEGTPPTIGRAQPISGVPGGMARPGATTGAAACAATARTPRRPFSPRRLAASRESPTGTRLRTAAGTHGSPTSSVYLNSGTRQSTRSQFVTNWRAAGLAVSVPAPVRDSSGGFHRGGTRATRIAQAALQKGSRRLCGGLVAGSSADGDVSVADSLASHQQEIETLRRQAEE